MNLRMILKNRGFLYGAVACVLLAACIRQSADPMQVYFRNTLLVTQPWGETDRMLIEPDGTYTQSGGRFPAAKGHWTYSAGQFCIQVMPTNTSEKPNPPFCLTLQGRKVGDSWTIQIGDQKAGFKIAPDRKP